MTPRQLTAEQIRAFRAFMGSGWTQSRLAQELGGSLRSVEDWEGSRRHPPRMLDLALLSLAGPDRAYDWLVFSDLLPERAAA